MRYYGRKESHLGLSLRSSPDYFDYVQVKFTLERIFKRRAYDDKHKIIVKISTLHPNEYFMIDDNDKREFSILSQGPYATYYHSVL